MSSKTKTWKEHPGRPGLRKDKRQLAEAKGRLSAIRETINKLDSVDKNLRELHETLERLLKTMEASLVLRRDSRI